MHEGDCCVWRSGGGELILGVGVVRRTSETKVKGSAAKFHTAPEEELLADRESEVNTVLILGKVTDGMPMMD